MSSPSFAAKRDARSILQLKTDAGPGSKYTFSIEGDKAFINGARMSRDAVIVSETEMSEILRVESNRHRTSQKQCNEGVFEHVSFVQGAEKNENGCIGDERFKAVFSAFKEVERHALKH
jgi:hypothetical protein